ncbi:MAG TPA: aminotransferase class V-fold PLP-dependent enzyme [Gaiellaceae bacterium]|nr:aminotransferase class V-fold PLP-dependent enzyme [Gaiellaceae bacterium]
MKGTIVPALAPLPLSVWGRRRREALPFPLAEPGCRLFARARNALHHALSERLEPGSEILAPAFHHGSEIEAFEQAGLVCRFYDATETLAPDEAELDALLSTRTRALHLIHYFGFPQDVRRWRAWCDERGLLLVEDAAQAWLAAVDGQPVGLDGDVAVFCLYKSFGLPDGAALVTRWPTNGTVPPAGKGLFWMALEHGLWLATRTRAMAWLADHWAWRIGTTEETMRVGRSTLPCAATLAALPRVADGAVAETRRRNYGRLLELLPDLVALPFAGLPDGASPFTFPAVFQDKPQALDRLRRNRVRALNLWSAPHPSVPAGGFPQALELRRTLVGLPVHQELRGGDVDRVALAVRAALAE